MYYETLYITFNRQMESVIIQLLFMKYMKYFIIYFWFVTANCIACSETKHIQAKPLERI